MNTTELIEIAKECNAGENQFGLYIFKIDELAKFAELLAKRNAYNMDVINNAREFVLDVNGNLCGLVAGDMGYEETGIKLNMEGWTSSLPAEQEAELIKDAERYRWLREISRDPDDGKPYCVVTTEVLQDGEPAKMVTYLQFDEALDAEIDQAIANRKED
jgi:hypothetical protein